MATPPLSEAREQFLALVGDIRPQLHRYCARLVGSTVTGEDIVQETLAKAFYALSLEGPTPPLRPWLFRIAHNAAIDHLRRHETQRVDPLDEPERVIDPDLAPDPAVVRAALASFLALPLRQRSAVILKDVLGLSLEEVAEVLDTTVLAVKAALVRGRAGLRAHDNTTATAHPSTLAPAERERLDRYASLFNARDWQGLRTLLAEECRLDLVSKAALRGAAVQNYYGRYSALPYVRVEPGTVESRPALLVYLREGASEPDYFILLGFADDRVATIRDFRYVPYIMTGIDWTRA